MRNIKQINIKKLTYDFFNDMINIKDFNPDLLKIDKKSYINIGIYYIGYITIKSFSDYESINSVIPLYLMIHEVIGHIKEKNGDKYGGELIDKYKEVCDGIKKEIKAISGDKEFEYEKDFVKIKFDSNDDLPLNKQLHFSTMTIIVRSAFEDDGKFYSQIYLDECLHQL